MSNKVKGKNKEKQSYANKRKTGKDVSFDEIAQVTTQNAKKLFTL